ncbi:7409_t:CDS:2 [Dentiscutata heterogama]|uniref:7409_t:CDS:1 n=1 Tax=Dentiscutata heterogama TaxID=1316150 RepID=A0ACA9KRV2_9GLOM|nr:7409_t:CDS:2 [Dentiscutata heterogama]
MKKKQRDKLPIVRQKVTEHNLKCEFITPSSKRGPPKGVAKKISTQESNKSDSPIQTEGKNLITYFFM